METDTDSASRELETALDSIEVKWGQLKQTGIGISQNLFKREDMKTVVDGLTSVMNVVDKLTSKFGLFGSIGLGAGIFAGIKNIGKSRISVRISNCFEYAPYDGDIIYQRQKCVGLVTQQCSIK